MLLIGGAALFLLYSLNCFVILPVRNMLANDVIFASNLLVSNIFNVLSQLAEVVAISVFYATLFLLIYRCGEKRGGKAFIVFAAATVYKYLANTAVSWIYDGSIPATWVWDVINVVFFTALEMLQMLVIFLISRGLISAYNEKREIRLKAAEKIGYTSDEYAEGAYPFKMLYDRSNCLLRSALVCAAVTVIAKGIGSLLSDIWLIAMYGFPEVATTWVMMLIGYGMKVIFGVGTYFVTVCAMNVLGKKDQR